jgi:predicted phage terminase large subunit-like protein
MSKSTLMAVMFPAWIFTTEPTAKILSVAHNLDLALRDSVRCRRLIQGEWYQDLWPQIQLAGDQNAKAKFEIEGYGGFRQALAAGAITGVRADHVVCDDLLSATDAMSEAIRNSMKDWVLEALPTRLNNPGGEKASTISLIQQRLHEEDSTGVLLEKNLGYEHLMLPMEYDPGRHCATSVGEDWRSEEGELLFPERFPREVVERDKQAMGPWASSSQFQQAPSPRGGGLIKRDQFLLYDDELARAQGKTDASKYPDLDIIIASVDTAYTTKQENDASAITVWGVWQKGGAEARSLISSYADNSNVFDMNGKRIQMVDERDTIPCAMLMYAKELRVPLHGDEVQRMEGESPEAFRRRAESKWGLCEHITDICKRFNVDTILIEAKASGISVAQEIKRLNKLASWQVKLVNPGNLDKVARVYSVQPIFANGQVYSPDKDWAEKVISQCETFPKGRRDDLVDTVSQGLRYLRDNGFLARADEVGARVTGEYYVGGNKKKQWVYDV